MNPFRAHTQYVQAQDAARQGGSNASLTGYNQMLLQLTEHRRRLKTVQSNERKAQLKREFLPAYASWIAGLLDADASGQDDVAMYVMIWRIDAGDYTGALDIARHAIKHGRVLPQRFDEVMRAFSAGESFSAAILTQVLDIVESQDMPDQSRARLHKAMGYALRDNDQAVAALNHLKRALQLDNSSGVKTEINKLESRLRQAMSA